MRVSVACLGAAVMLPVAACDSSTEPSRQIAVNTMAITATGALELDEVVGTISGFQHVPAGEGSGLHLSADVGGLPFAIHLPGVPQAGRYTLGPWDPSGDFVREDTVQWVGRKPSISFGNGPAAALNHYSSTGAGTLEIDAVEIMEPDDFWGLGTVRGRITTQLVADSRLVPPGTPVNADTVDVTAEFHAEIENWPDGRAAVQFLTGEYAGRSASRLVGSGSMYMIGEDADDRLIISVSGSLTEGGERIWLWFGTKLRGPGSTAVAAIDADAAVRPMSWPDEFVAAMIDDRQLTSLDGTIELEVFEPYSYERWGEVKGRIVVDLGVLDPSGTRLEPSTTEVTFHVPVGFLIGYNVPDGSARVTPRLGPTGSIARPPGR